MSSAVGLEPDNAGNKDNLVSEMKPKRILEVFPCVVDEGNSVTLLFNIRRIRECIENLSSTTLSHAIGTVAKASVFEWTNGGGKRTAAKKL